MNGNREKIKVRVYSDIHLDHYVGREEPKFWYPPELPDDKDTILVLAGDLWIGTRWIDYMGFSWIGKLSNQFKQVLVVLGNHDYWPANHPLSIRTGARKCNDMLHDMAYFNVKVLDMEVVDIGDVIFVGATLWTDMRDGDPLTMNNMPSYMSYDGKIAYEIGEEGAWTRFTSQRWVGVHRRHKEYIRLVAQDNPDKAIVVITHHLPLEFISDPVYAGDSSNAYYSSDMSDVLLDNPNITHWFYGHSHYCNDTTFEGCRLVNNSVGYQGEHKEQAGLVKHEVIEI
jgi:predicted MPP superfamily phosphohydrolase